MTQNPLIGSRISLISKKNIRYEGTLYSINEQDATVALQNVKSYGTEGREQADPSGTFVPTQDAIHPYLVFRGSDIKDLHVHEHVQPPLPAKPAPQKPTGTPKDSSDTQKPSDKSTQMAPKQSTPSKAPRVHKPKELGVEKGNKHEARTRNSSRKQRGRRNPQHQVGTGASLLNRKARGVVDSNPLPAPNDEFDFQSNLANFEKEEDDNEEQCTYEKDNFFDSISCDALDRQSGRDNRLRGSQERSLNTETFGAVALNGNRRYNRRGRGGGRGRGRGRGRGGGRGRGRGRGRSRYHGDRARTNPTTNRVVEAS